MSFFLMNNTISKTNAFLPSLFDDYFGLKSATLVGVNFEDQRTIPRDLPVTLKGGGDRVPP